MDRACTEIAILENKRPKAERKQAQLSAIEAKSVLVKAMPRRVDYDYWVIGRE